MIYVTLIAGMLMGTVAIKDLSMLPKTGGMVIPDFAALIPKRKPCFKLAAELSSGEVAPT